MTIQFSRKVTRTTLMLLHRAIDRYSDGYHRVLNMILFFFIWIQHDGVTATRVRLYKTEAEMLNDQLSSICKCSDIK